MPVFIWYLLNVFKALVFQDILSKFCSLAVHHNFFFFGRVQETLSPDLFAASSDRGGATWEGGANGWQLKKTPETEHCFPVISALFVPSQELADCCQFTQISFPVGMHPNHKTLLLPPWFNTSLSAVKDWQENDEKSLTALVTCVHMNILVGCLLNTAFPYLITPWLLLIRKSAIWKVKI